MAKIFMLTLSREGKKFLNWKFFIIFILIIIIYFILFFDGTNKYNDTLREKDIFLKKEKLKVTNLSMIRQYAAMGIKLMFVPSKYSILQNYPNTLLADIDTADRLNIYKSNKGRNYIRGENFLQGSNYMTYLGFTFLLLVLFSMLYGLNLTKNKKRLMFLSTSKNGNKFFITMIFSRIIILSLLFFLVITIPVIVLNLRLMPLLYLILKTFVLILSCFAIGSIIGILNEKLSLLLLPTIYFILIVLVPIFCDKVTHTYATYVESLSNFELHNMNIILKAEKELLENFGTLKPGETRNEIQKAVKEAIENQHLQIENREKKFLDSTVRQMRKRSLISSLFPTTSYLDFINEITGQGVISYKNFCLFTLTRKKEFIDYYFRNRFTKEKINKSEIQRVLPFINKDNAFYYSKSTNPSFNLFSIAISFIYFLIPMIFVFSKFRNLVNKNRNVGINKEIPEGQLIYYQYNLRETDTSSILKFLFDKELIKERAIYLPNPSEIDLSKKSIAVCMNIDEKVLNEFPVWKILITGALEKSKVIIGDGFLNDLDEGEEKSIIYELKSTLQKKEGVFIEIGRNRYIASFFDNKISDKDEIKEYKKLFSKKL